MPRTVAHALRIQSKQCLDVAKRTNDPAVKEELLSAAAWLHEEATKIEAMLGPPRGGGSGGPGVPPTRRTKQRTHPAPNPPPRRHQPAALDVRQRA
jgi:hypothetical protein